MKYLNYEYNGIQMKYFNKTHQNFQFFSIFGKNPVSELSRETICSAILIEYSICCTIQHAAFLYWDVRKDDQKTGELRREINRDLNRCEFFDNPGKVDSQITQEQTT